VQYSAESLVAILVTNTELMADISLDSHADLYVMQNTEPQQTMTSPMNEKLQMDSASEYGVGVRSGNGIWRDPLACLIEAWS